MSRICISGIGIVSPIGNDVGENLGSLRKGNAGLSSASYLNSQYSDRLPLGEVKLSNEELCKKLNVSDPAVTRTTLLALHAFREAVADAQLDENKISDPSTAFISATTVGGMCLTDEMYRDANSTGNGSRFLRSYDFASVAIYIASLYKMRGVVNTINTACSSSANAIMMGARLIGNGLADRAIVGGADSLSKFTVNGFNALGILSDEKCRPFDHARKGLNLGEAGAFLVLEKEKDTTGKPHWGFLSGYGNASDAYHPSSLSEQGEGPYLSMLAALEGAILKPGDIDFINAHGTATENNDLVESRAIKRIFEKAPPFMSTKCYTGHTLAAAGAVEAVFSLLGLANQEMYPALQFSVPIPETGLTPVTEFKSTQLRHVLSNSFGFGGNCSALIFSAS